MSDLRLEGSGEMLDVWHLSPDLMLTLQFQITANNASSIPICF